MVSSPRDYFRVLAYACPECRAAGGDRCETPEGRLMFEDTHFGRRLGAALHTRLVG